MKSSHWDVQAVYKQLIGLANARSERVVDVPRFDSWVVARIVLDELSRTCPEVCNLSRVVDLLDEGRNRDAYFALKLSVEGITVVSPLHAWVKAQAKACLSKLPIPGIDREAAAYKLWFSDEHRCRRTNQKLVAYRNRFLKGREAPWMHEVSRMREFCAYVLGDSPDLQLIAEESRYGPGASVEVRGDATHYANKLLSWDCTSGCVDLAVDALALDKGAWEVFGFDPRESTNPSAIDGFKREARKMVSDSVVNHDTLMFIFKNAEALRSITVQPTLSGMVQLGIDAAVKQLLLRKCNVDLTDQSLNRRLAFLGSRDWESPDPWCTIDKKSASNLVAKLLPGFVFPGAWSKLLWSTRSPFYRTPPAMGSDTRAYEMYAGMGNGTTFGIESLIFLSAAYAVSGLMEPSAILKDRFFSIFGDDLLIRKSNADRYVLFIEYLGFRINRDKSFLEGPFRESCGADYWSGVNVRPAYVRGEDGYTDALELIGLHNTLADSSFFCMLTACKRLRALWKKNSSLPLPSDHSGGLGFRTFGREAWSYVEKAGNPVISTVWHRPRGYYLEVRPKLDKQNGASMHVNLNIALLRGGQDYAKGVFGLPFRAAYNLRVVPEMDLRKKDLILMLSNQLQRLALRKITGWWIPSRGLK